LGGGAAEDGGGEARPGPEPMMATEAVGCGDMFRSFNP